jgi:proteasome accessory factor C
VTLVECAAHFEVSEEQLERDLWLLVVCGVPGYGPDQLVDIQFWDEAIHVLDPQTLKRPLRLSQEEALTLLIALRMLAQVPGVQNREAIVSAAVKLENASSAVDSERQIAVHVAVDPQIAAVFDAALSESREVIIRYAAATRDEVTLRTIRPRRLFTTDGVMYLEAYCLAAEALRTFRLDRVLEARLGDPSPTEVSEDVVAPTAPRRPVSTALLAIDSSARWIVDVHEAAEDDSPRADGRTIVRLPLHSFDWGVRLVLSLRGAAIVLEPPDLVVAVAGASSAALAAYPDVIRDQAIQGVSR